jgi:hypothetical protein
MPERRGRHLVFPVILIAVIAASTWSAGHVPAHGVLGHLGAISSLASQAVDKLSDRWTIQLRLDPAASSPAPRWTVNDASRMGEGHELVFDGESRSLLLRRAHGRFLLGAARLDGMPARIDLSRRGSWFTVNADGAEILRCLDPLANGPDAKETRGWGIQVEAGAMGEADLTLLDDSLGEGERGDASEEAALTGVRAVLASEDASAPDARALEDAAVALAALPQGSDLHRHLRHWLGLAEARLALARDLAEDEPDTADATARARDAVQQLGVLARLDPVPESVGMMMSLLPRIAEGVGMQPPLPAPGEAAPAPGEAALTKRQQYADLVLNRHEQWLDILGLDAASALESASPAMGDSLLYELRLVDHAAGCLARSPGRTLHGGDEVYHAQPSPVPAEAPPWLAARWRAFSGEYAVAAALPDPPAGLATGPVPSTVEALEQDAVLEPAGAVVMCTRLREMLARPDVAQALAAAQVAPPAVQASCQAAIAGACDRAPAREAALAQVLLALRGLLPIETAAQGLLTPSAQGSALAVRDPLAYALLSALLSADPSVLGQVPAAYRAGAGARDPIPYQGAGATSMRPRAAPAFAPLLAQPEALRELANFARLLSGEDDATSQAWRMRTADLPPAQALAAALEMQALLLAPGGARRVVRWDLLARVRSYTLPLELLAPPAPAPASGPRGPDALP